MAAPATALTNGAGTITATGEDNGLLIPIGATVSRPRLLLGISGTFTSAVIAVRGRLRGLTNYYPVPGSRRAGPVPVGSSASVALTADSTAEVFEFDVTGCDYAEVYCVSGTPTSLGVEARVAPADPNAVPVVSVSVAAPSTITSASPSALAVGPNGATNPVLKIDASTSSAATGVSVTGAAAGARVAIAAISSGTNEGLDLNAKGSGTIRIGNSSTGAVQIGGNAATVLPGTLTGGGLLTCALQVATSGPLIYSGSGAPTISAAVKGSLYLRSDGSTTNDRIYVATNTSGTWTALTTAA